MNNNTMQSQLASRGFKTVDGIADRSSFGTLLSTKRRCGIYVLHFKNGWYYVGQSVNVVQRCSAHWKNHMDIQKISFKPMGQRNLAHEESATISALQEAGWQLHNKVLISIPYGEAKFDNIMAPADQRKWQSDLTYTDTSGTRTFVPQMREKYTQNYLRYQHVPFANQVTAVLRTYVQKCIPVPIRSEFAFWGISCLPSYGSPNVTVYSRITMFWQEVFTVEAVNGTINFIWHLARSPFDDKLLKCALATYPTLKTRRRGYKSGGSDQFRITVSSVEEALQILDDVKILKAIRLFNMRLCRKGHCNNSRYHCFDLVDELLDVQVSK